MSLVTRSTLRHARALTVALCLAAVPLHGQDRASVLAHATAPTIACIAAAPPTGWNATPVYVRTKVAAGRDAAFFDDATVIAGAVAALARAAYGDEVLQSAEPLITWRSLGQRVRVTAFRDGRLTWRRDSTRVASETTGVELLQQAVDAVVAAHAVPAWPAKLAVDSVDFSLALDELPGDGSKANVSEPTAWSRRALFTLRLPPMTPAADEPGHRSARYPEANRMRGMEGALTVDFVIDSTGRAEPESFHAQGAEAVARMNPPYRRAYQEFITSIRANVLESHFRPAVVAGCRARMHVAKQFAFQIQ